MNAHLRYTTPAAFRRALSDRIRNEATGSHWTVQQLQRQVAYDRFLDRLYLVDDGWIVKGATALLARDLGVRASLDIDLLSAKARDVADAEVRQAAAADIGDWFRFEIRGESQIGANGIRLPVTAFIGGTPWVEFHIDIVGTNVVMTGQPDDVRPLARGLIPGVDQRQYRAYPLVDHTADKVAAMFERHGERQVPSTRYRDLVDLVAIATGATMEAEALGTAISAEFSRRQLSLPLQIAAPDRALWEAGYAAEADHSLLNIATTLDDALELVGSFINPILEGSARGHWLAAALSWSG